MTITQPESPDFEGYYLINNCKMWIRVNGGSKSLPVLLLLHGGPGFPCSGMSRGFQDELEKHFIVVNWDQRGAGKSYHKKIPTDTMKIKQFIEDGLQVSLFLISHFNKPKIYLVALSFGTLIGLKLAQQHPEHFYAYLSSGQMLDMSTMESMSYSWTLSQAILNKNKKAIKQLNIIGTPPYRNTKDLVLVRKWTTKFGGNTYPHTSPWKLVRDFILFAPHYTLKDKIKTFSGLSFSLKCLVNEILSTDLTAENTPLKIPMSVCVGRHDHLTPYEVIEPYYKSLDAPYKELIFFENSGHTAFMTENEKFQETIIRFFNRSDS